MRLGRQNKPAKPQHRKLGNPKGCQVYFLSLFVCSVKAGAPSSRGPDAERRFLHSP